MDEEEETFEGNNFSQINPEVWDHYTDILCHEFAPQIEGKTVLAAGTNFGNLYITSKTNEGSNSAEFSPDKIWESSVEFPVFEPVLSLSWGKESDSSLYFLSSRKLYHLRDYKAENAIPECFFGPFMDKSDFMDFAMLKNTGAFCFVSDRSQTVVVDQVKRKITLQLQDHKGVVQVVKTTDEYVATGGIDGIVNLYDGRFRTRKKITSFDTKNSVNNLEINDKSVWLAVSGTKSSEFPSVYNIRSGKQIPTSSEKSSEREKISGIHFDCNDTLYWGGSDGYLYKSDDLLLSKTEIKGTYGRANIPHILSITTTQKGNRKESPLLSVAGATNSILFSSGGIFWDAMVQVCPKRED